MKQRTGEHFRRQIEAVKQRYKEERREFGDAMFHDFLSAVNAEIERLKAELRKAERLAQRVRLKSALAKMEASKADLYRKFNRKPPESGIAMPVEPPRGPLPMQGGAAAPLEFD